MVALVVTTFRKPGPSAQGFFQSLADVACSTGVVDHGSWLRIAQQYLSCALVRGCGMVFRYYSQSMAKSAGKDFRDGAVVPFEWMWMILGPSLFCLLGLLLYFRFSVVIQKRATGLGLWRCCTPV